MGLPCAPYEGLRNLLGTLRTPFPAGTPHPGRRPVPRQEKTKSGRLLGRGLGMGTKPGPNSVGLPPDEEAFAVLVAQLLPWPAVGLEPAEQLLRLRLRQPGPAAL